MNRELRKIGICVSEKRVAGIIRELGLVAQGASHRCGRQRRVEPENLRINPVEQVSAMPEPDPLRIGDITCIPTKRGRLYLAAVMDASSRKATGWSMPGQMRENLVIDALGQAVGREEPGPGLIFHDGQDARSTTKAFQRAIGRHGTARSVSRPGNPYGNAVAESFFKTPKRELTKGAAFEDHDQAKQEIFKYIELYCNTKRMHSTLGYKSPVEYERINARKPLNICPI
jgi:putative transposase